jgi:anti-sigma B factor antagonist
MAGNWGHVMALQISMREKGDVAILDLAGELIAGECPALPQQVKKLLSLGKRKIAINLSEVGYVDSTGLGSLVASFTSVRSQDGALRLLSPSPVISAAIQVTLLDRVMQTYSREADALASFD